MRLVFLDIDGVMNHIEHRQRSPYHKGQSFCPDSVKQLKRILKTCEAQLVLSSTWRKGETTKTLRKRLFSHYGLQHYLVGKTPILQDKIREKEIEWFLSRFKKPVESFIIIDDDNDMGEFNERLVRTSPYHYGLTEEKANEAIHLLLNKDAKASPDSFNEHYHRSFMKKYQENTKKE